MYAEGEVREKLCVIVDRERAGIEKRRCLGRGKGVHGVGDVGDNSWEGKNLERSGMEKRRWLGRERKCVG